MTVATATAVLQVRSSAGLYGADRMVITLNGALAAQGAHSRLLSINNYRMDAQPVHDAAIALGQDARLLPCNGRLDTRTASALSAQIATFPANIVHVHDYKSAFYGWLATRRRPARLVTTLHGWVENSRSQRLYHRLEMSLLKRFDALVVVAGEQVDRLVAAGLPRERIHQVDNAIEAPAADIDSAADKAALRSELGLPPVGFVIAAVGRLSPEKNLGLLIDAFIPVAASDTTTHLLIVGAGDERESLQAHAAQAGLCNRVIFTGMRSDMPRIYRLIHCLALSSSTEGMPLVVLEAMARGIPIVATSVGDVPRLIRHTDHGCVVPRADTAALATALLAAVAAGVVQDEAAQRYIAANHFPETMARAYLDIYHSLLANEHGRKAS